MKLLILFAAVLFPALPITDFDTAVLTVTGASCMEDLDESLLDRLRSYAEHPIDLNSCGRSKLLSCGLMNAFQVASLLEYRQQTGDILSYAELSLIDGFPEEYVAALRHFTVLTLSDRPPGQREGRAHHDLMLRGAVKTNEGSRSQTAWGAKYRFTAGNRAEFFWGSRTTYSDGTVRPGTFSAALYGRKYLGKVVLGHFAARFGQGLAQWSGFSMSPYSGVGCLSRSGTGFSATGSMTPDLCGAAADFSLGRWTAGCGYSIKERLPIANLTYTLRSFTAGFTATSKAVSADWRIGIPNASVYGELAWKKGIQALCGVMWIPVYGTKVAAVCRYINGAPEVLAGIGAPGLDAIAAWSASQARAMVKYAPALPVGQFKLTPSLRLAAKHKDTWRLEGRGEMQLERQGWMLHSRLDIVHCSGTSWLVNAEAGRSEGKLRAWARWTLFKVEDWDDRIYVYERDAPGNFNVPAYYGKGWSLSAYLAFKPVRRHSFYTRVSYITYPWMTEPKPSRFEVKLQYGLSL